MKPILFNTEMVKAIIDGRKTVTRRLIKPQPMGCPVPSGENSYWPGYFAIQDSERVTKPPFNIGEILYVRETWHESEGCWIFKADYSEQDAARVCWRPSIHMPKQAARIFLKVTGVRAERLQDCGNMQAKEEGCSCCSEFARVWNRTIKQADQEIYGWQANPWVWVIEFEATMAALKGD